MRRFIFVVVLAGCSRVCGSHAANDAGTSTTSASTSPNLSLEGLLPKELADSPPFGNDDKRAVCGKTITGTCDILQTKSAGKDAQGCDLAVITVRTIEPLDAGGGDFDPENGVESREHWVIGRKDGVIVFRAPIAAETAHTDVNVDASLKIGSNELELDEADVAPSSWNW